MSNLSVSNLSMSNLSSRRNTHVTHVGGTLTARLYFERALLLLSPFLGRVSCRVSCLMWTRW
jgi:hypothetical protein